MQLNKKKMELRRKNNLQRKLTLGLTAFYTEIRNKAMQRKFEQGDNLGSLTVDKLLGSGTFGVVYRCNDRAKIMTAVKVFRMGQQNYAQREVQINRLLHSYDVVIQMHQSFVHEGFPCICFELASGNLRQLLSSTRQVGMSFSKVRRVTSQILNSLAYLSSLDIIHCDVKPENILLCGHERWKLGDFGIACLGTNKWSHQYNKIQPLAYRSPEIIMQRDYSTPIDMWSCGCILFEMLTSTSDQGIFRGQDEHDQLVKIIEVLGMPPKEHVDKAPSKLRESIFDKTRTRMGEQWTLKPAWSRRETNVARHPHQCLHDILAAMRTLGQTHEDDPEHIGQCVDLMAQMLYYDTNKRITPSGALKHPFLSPPNAATPVDAS